MYCSFRFPRVALREMAVEGEGSFFSGPKEKKEPGPFAALEKNGREFASGNDHCRLEIGFHGEDLRFVDDELYRDKAGESGTIFRAVQDQLTAEFGRHFAPSVRCVGPFILCVGSQNRRQQNGGHKESQAKDGSDPTLRKREGKKDECGAKETESQAKNEPGMLIAARMQVVGKRRMERGALYLGIRRGCVVGGGRAGDLAHACLETRAGWARGIMLAGNGADGAEKRWVGKESGSPTRAIVVENEIGGKGKYSGLKEIEQNEGAMKMEGRVSMKWVRTLPLALALGLVLTPGANPGAPQSDDASKIVAMENLWNQMQLNHDAVAMEKMIDEDFVLTDYDGTVLDKKQFLDSIKDMSIKLTQEMSEGMKLHPHGNTVVITGATREKGTQNGKAFAHNGRFTDTWIKKEGRWICVASHLGVVSK
jgi:ketosteroid isomerase-like protein